MTDLEVLDTLATTLPQWSHYNRNVYMAARQRVQRGGNLTYWQRRRLLRLLSLAAQWQMTQLTTGRDTPTKEVF